MRTWLHLMWSTADCVRVEQPLVRYFVSWNSPRDYNRLISLFCKTGIDYNQLVENHDSPKVSSIRWYYSLTHWLQKSLQQSKASSFDSLLHHLWNQRYLKNESSIGQSDEPWQTVTFSYQEWDAFFLNFSVFKFLQNFSNWNLLSALLFRFCAF